MAADGLGLGTERLRIIDAHTHLAGPKYDGTPEDAIKFMDAAGIDISFVFAPLLQPSGLQLSNEHINDMRMHNDYCANFCSFAPERLYAFAILNPSPQIGSGDPAKAAQIMAEEAERCYHELGMRGVGEMVSDKWRAEDDALRPLWDKITELGMYVVFHAGIFLDERSSTYCRPTYFEALHLVRNFKGQLAHLGWPWVDELIAALLMESQHPDDVQGDPWQLKADFSFGCPPDWRVPSLQRAMSALQQDQLIFGSDHWWPMQPESYFDTYLLPHLSSFEVACDLSGKVGDPGSADRRKYRQMVFHDNVMEHYEAATRNVPQQPKKRPHPPDLPNARPAPQ